MEPRRQARAYLLGLLSPISDKRGWTLAEAAGDRSPDAMQRLLNRTVWDPDAVGDDLRDHVRKHLDQPGGVLIVNETGFVKKGVKSAGVQRQYSGTVGRVENCQLGVFLAYATPQGRVLLDRELYLPKSWRDDLPRQHEAGIDDSVAFATKPVLGLRMLGRALDAGLPAPWATADEAYGKDGKFRLELQRRHVGYVLAVPANQKVPTERGSARADAWPPHPICTRSLGTSAWHDRQSRGCGRLRSFDQRSWVRALWPVCEGFLVTLVSVNPSRRQKASPGSTSGCRSVGAHVHPDDVLAAPFAGCGYRPCSGTLEF